MNAIISFIDKPSWCRVYRSDAMRVGHWLQLFGFVCLAVLVMSHIAEKLELFPVMGWGLPDSPGHYLNLTIAALGCALFPRGHHHERGKEMIGTKRCPHYHRR